MIHIMSLNRDWNAKDSTDLHFKKTEQKQENPHIITLVGLIYSGFITNGEFTSTCISRRMISGLVALEKE